MTFPRREFLAYSLGLAVAGPAIAGGDSDEAARRREALAGHRIADVRVARVQLRWPRLVGKNSRLDVHGRGPRVTVCRVTTDRKASGWGLLRGNPDAAPALRGRLKGRPLAELFDPAVGVTDPAAAALDFALHDLSGVVLGMPVYEMLGRHGPPSSPCYSGMIYFDDLEPPEKPAGIDQVLKNCESDVEYGYRQLKVKIGRGNKWMKPGPGTRRDVEVTRAIAERFPEVEILVDGNDGFTVERFLAYMEGIGDVKLFWIEEPFRESVADYAKLRTWLREHERETLLADGEAAPDWKVLDELADRKLLDVQLVDIAGYGFTAWRKLMPGLKRKGVQASPHAWGSLLKTYYTSHLAAGLGNVVTVEGVTCASDEIDFGKYALKDGKLTPSPDPGFGMRLRGE